MPKVKVTEETDWKPDPINEIPEYVDPESPLVVEIAVTFGKIWKFWLLLEVLVMGAVIETITVPEIVSGTVKVTEVSVLPPPIVADTPLIVIVLVVPK